MKLIFFTFFEFFLLNQLILAIWSETDTFNQRFRVSNDSIKLNHDNSSRQSFSELENLIKVDKKLKDKKNYNLSVSNPSNSLLEEKIKISIKDSNLHSNGPIYFEPSLQKLIRNKNSYNYKSRALVFKPSVNSLEKELFNNSQNVAKSDDDLSIDNLNNLVKINFENKYEKKRLRAFLPSYQGFHGEIYHNQQAFKHENIIKERRTERSADINDYNRWLEDENKISRLERFKKLYEEFSKLGTHSHDHDFKVKNENNTQIEQPLIKLKKTIKKIEEEEQRKHLKHEL